MLRAGDCAWIDTTILGKLSGGAHTCVVLSTAAYAHSTGLAIAAPLRRPNGFTTGVLLQPNDLRRYTPAGLDQARILDLSQLYTVPLSEISAPIGRLHEGKLRTLLRELATMSRADAGPLQGRLARVDGVFADGSCVVFDVIGRDGGDAGWHVVAEYAHGNPQLRFTTVARDRIVFDERRISATLTMDFLRRVRRALGIDVQLAS
ncbi:MAG: type II toxin-antitoxin system PemK/MazF family toxin [Gemmatimonadaceae bacterium]|nr:type II toxin-antitoxin system PemK/MazF family toxin [Gemmatimonadaceae bacterium]